MIDDGSIWWRVLCASSARIRSERSNRDIRSRRPSCTMLSSWGCEPSESQDEPMKASGSQVADAMAASASARAEPQSRDML